MGNARVYGTLQIGSGSIYLRDLPLQLSQQALKLPTLMSLALGCDLDFLQRHQPR